MRPVAVVSRRLESVSKKENSRFYMLLILILKWFIGVEARNYCLFQRITLFDLCYLSHCIINSITLMFKIGSYKSYRLFFPFFFFFRV
jgi:hypothetical protein